MLKAKKAANKDAGTEKDAKKVANPGKRKEPDVVMLEAPDEPVQKKRNPRRKRC